MPWYVAMSSSEDSVRLVELCKKNGGKAYCPMVRGIKRISRSHKTVEVANPAYPGYFFISVGSEEKFQNCDKQRFRLMVYGKGDTAVQISDKAIDLIVSEEQGWNDNFERKRGRLEISVGQSVRISSGLFKGSVGSVIYCRKGFAEISVYGVILKINCLLLENSGA